MNLSFLLNPLESGTNKDDKDPLESEPTSTPTSANKVTSSSSTDTPQRSTGDKVSLAVDCEIDSTVSRVLFKKKGRNLRGHTDDDPSDDRRPRHLNPFDQSPLAFIQEAVVETSPLPRSGMLAAKD